MGWYAVERLPCLRENASQTPAGAFGFEIRFGVILGDAQPVREYINNLKPLRVQSVAGGGPIPRCKI